MSLKLKLATMQFMQVAVLERSQLLKQKSSVASSKLSIAFSFLIAILKPSFVQNNESKLRPIITKDDAQKVISIVQKKDVKSINKPGIVVIANIWRRLRLGLYMKSLKFFATSIYYEARKN